MTTESTSDLALIEATPLPPADENSKQARAAVRRCTAAWKRACDAHIESSPRDGRVPHPSRSLRRVGYHEP